MKIQANGEKTNSKKVINYKLPLAFIRWKGYNYIQSSLGQTPVFQKDIHGE